MTTYLNDKNQKNADIRAAIRDSHLRHYEVAELLGVHPCTLASWLVREMPKEKKELILSALKQAQ